MTPSSPGRADDPDLADAAHGWRSAYVHIPFCRRRCPYCDFAIVESADETLHERYVEAVVTEIERGEAFAPLDAINLGGGTPSLVRPALIARIIAALIDRYGGERPEVSIEVNPEDWGPELAEGLVESGVDRVSIGAQSMNEAVLGALGRLHAADQVRTTVEGARAVGMRSVGVDLIIGHPTETDAMWDATVADVIAMDVDHVSTYALTVEPGTPLAASVRDGGPAPDDDIQAERYERFIDRASAAGIDRYEVSNHARPGHHCRYNLATWAHGEYLGFGMAAHGHRWGRRSRNHRRFDRYLEAVEAGVRPRLGEEQLDHHEQERDRLMLGLRLAAGTPISGIGRRFAETSDARRYEAAGLLRIGADRMVVTDPLRADMVARSVLSVPLGDC